WIPLRMVGLQAPDLQRLPAGAPSVLQKCRLFTYTAEVFEVAADFSGQCITRHPTVQVKRQDFLAVLPSTKVKCAPLRAEVKRCYNLHEGLIHMRILVVADIHANWPALQAITEPHDLCLCLGDLVDYALEPAACINWVRRNARHAIRGNHDHDVAQNVIV